KIADGDTATVTDLNTGEQVKVRFAGIDAPESKQQFGQEAKRELERLLSRKGKLSVLPREIDRYGRTVGELYLDGTWINLEMVKNGYAWHYAAYSKDSRLAAAMEEAKKAKRGLWSKRSPVPPWEWRQEQREK